MSGTLNFFYSTMNAGKTFHLINCALEAKIELHRSVIIIGSKISSRRFKDHGMHLFSRAGTTIEANHLFTPTTDFEEIINGLKVDIIFIDECQFLNSVQVEQLYKIAHDKFIEINCYGLMTDFMSHLFEGSESLVRFANKIVTLKTETRCLICFFKFPIINARVVRDSNNKIKFSLEGPKIDIEENEEKFLPVCYKCWRENIID